MDKKATFTLVVVTAALFTLTNASLFSTSYSRPGWRVESPRAALRSAHIDINEFLEGVIDNFRQDMLTGIPELKVPVLDPFHSNKPAIVDVNDSNAVVHANFSNIHVEGMSKFIMEHLHTDLHNLTLRFHLRIPWIRAVGNYTLDGKVIKIIPLRGAGGFRVESLNLSVSATASMETSNNDHLQLSQDFDVEMDFDKVELQLENFLGGGRWTEVLIKILNDISRDLFKKCLPLLKGELNKSLLKVINKHLMKLPITSIIPGSSADEYIDQILRNVQTYIRENDLDPMKLPDFAKNFSKEVMYVTFTGSTKMYDGWLEGISTLHRTDECELLSNKTTVSISAHLGLTDLRLSYKGEAKFLSWGPSLICGGSVKKVSFYFEVEQSNRKGAKPRLRDFEIVELSTIWVELSGLGPLTWILKWLLTGISKMVEDFIVEKVTFYVREYLETEFQKVSFPV